MTYEEALKDLDGSFEITIQDPNFIENFKKISGVEALEIAYKAIEKQIPKKPIPQYTTIGLEKRLVSYKCPCCSNSTLGNNEYKFNCCEECGQALDWSEENDMFT